MASRPVKLKLLPRSVMKAKSLMRLPTQILGGTGILVARSAGTWTVSVDAANLPAVVGLVIGTNVQAFDADLSALAANSTNGLWAHTGAGTGAARTITGTAAEITVTFGDGVSGNPTISIPAAVTFTGKTITGGTFSSPTLSGANGTFTGANTFTNAGTAAIDIRSGASGSLANFTIGRTATEIQFGVVAAANQFITGSAGGDSAIAALAGTLWLVSGTFGISVNSTTGATVFPAGITVGGASVLGTPTSITLTNATGLPVSTGISGLGTGVATFLATPSSANLRGALTDESGTGAAYFQGGDLGTPSAGVLTSATGLPISSGVAGLGTGVATFLATPSSANLRAALTDEVGTGAAYFVGGALGTPASATLTNATGLPLAGLATQAAFTLVGNNTSGAAVPTAVDIATLTAKASPAATDLIILSDQAASGAWKKATVSSVASAGSVASIDGATGAFTTGNGIETSSNQLRITLPETAKSANYTILAADRGKCFSLTSAATLSLTAAATLGNGHIFEVDNAGTGLWVIDPNSTELINGATTINLYPGERCWIVCNGTAFRTIGLSSSVLLDTQTASSSATLDFSKFLDGYFDEYEFKITSLIPATDVTDLWFRVSVDGGSTYRATASDYRWAVRLEVDGAAGVNTGSTGDVKVVLATIASNSTARPIAGTVRLSDISNTARFKNISWDTFNYDSTPQMCVRKGSAILVASTSAVGAARFLMSSGNIAAGTIRLYGLRK